jgi:LysR family transcriptional regulator, transcriptional activator of the cysJI operon
MRSDRLQLFVTVAKHLSITQAAREHRISQPAVSRHLKLLQQELGFSLLKKKGRGIQLTRSGRALFAQGVNIFSQFDAFKLTHGKQKQESLTLAGSHGPCTYLLPSLITDFNQTHPSATLKLRMGSSAEIEEWLLTSDVDLAVISKRTTSPSLHMEPFRNEELVAFAVPSYPLAGKKSVSRSEFGNIRLIVKIRRKGQSRTETQLCDFAKRGVKFKTVMGFESSQSVKEAVRRGAGVGLLFRDTVEPDQSGRICCCQVGRTRRDEANLYRLLQSAAALTHSARVSVAPPCFSNQKRIRGDRESSQVK